MIKISDLAGHAPPKSGPGGRLLRIALTLVGAAVMLATLRDFADVADPDRPLLLLRDFALGLAVTALLVRKRR